MMVIGKLEGKRAACVESNLDRIEAGPFGPRFSTYAKLPAGSVARQTIILFCTNLAIAGGRRAARRNAGRPASFDLAGRVQRAPGNPSGMR